jgi:hypothetical protein
MWVNLVNWYSCFQVNSFNMPDACVSFPGEGPRVPLAAFRRNPLRPLLAES